MNRNLLEFEAYFDIESFKFIQLRAIFFQAFYRGKRRVTYLFCLPGKVAPRGRITYASAGAYAAEHTDSLSRALVTGGTYTGG